MQVLTLKPISFHSESPLPLSQESFLLSYFYKIRNKQQAAGSNKSEIRSKHLVMSSKQFLTNLITERHIMLELVLFLSRKLPPGPDLRKKETCIQCDKCSVNGLTLLDERLGGVRGRVQKDFIPFKIFATVSFASAGRTELKCCIKRGLSKSIIKLRSFSLWMKKKKKQELRVVY